MTALKTRTAPKFIDIASVTPSSPCTRSAQWIEEMAEMIIEVGNIRPIYVEATGAEEYTIVNGSDIYYAAVRAMEIDDTLELISAVIITDANRAAVEKQLALMV